MDIRRLEEQEERVETGPIQFGDDWPGFFLRGDDCAKLIATYETLKICNDHVIYRTIMDDFINQLKTAVLK